jgi:hypothetical protein
MLLLIERLSKLKSGFILIALIHVSSSYGQLKFFITPSFNFKTAIAFVDPASLNNTQKNIFENQYFYQPYAVAFNSRVIKHPAFGYGISLGLMNKSGSRFMQLSFHKDVANYKASSFFRPYYDEAHFGYGMTYYGIGISRITLNYSFRIFDNHQFMQPWFSVGAGAFINRNDWTTIFPQEWNLPVSSNGDMLLRTYVQPFQERRINAFVKIGFENDFYWKKKYLVSLNAFFIQGLGTISRIEYVHEYTINGEFVHSGTGLMSRGSGFYWEVSRRFQVFPIKKTKNKMAE